MLALFSASRARDGLTLMVVPARFRSAKTIAAMFDEA
jgi:hypothetical protein